ncbi:SusD/RagB family nutrient-binding outer membrane lipoprotein [Algibacter pacificus]|uniref:SusD/RagB family nutrient-binding outer membrane lipoprotein n=1 Tax=Algibacter pacificus TaxID=2599389 RepID=UPI0011CAD121|nr:SusD/RagB family nutrient-binding outer membrane lipoprotein [Algibacter pacificus]
MKNIIIKITSIFLIFSIIIFTGCEDNFDEINTNPSEFTEVPTHFFLPGSILTIANAENHYYDGYLYPSTWIQYTTQGQSRDATSYNYQDVRSRIWSTIYQGPLVDLDRIVVLADQENNLPLKAVAMTLKAYSYTLLVNTFGDLPYAEFNKVDQGINQPIYDLQSEIFNNILENLREVDTLLEGVSAIDIPLEYDLIYNGDALKWRKFANSLRFRLLIQLSEIRDVSSELSSIAPVFENASDNAMYQFSGVNVGDIYPPSSALGPDATEGQVHRMAAPLISRMNQTNDPRRSLYAVANDDGQYLGAYTYETFGLNNNYSKINPQFFDRNGTATFMDYSELLFLKAEAVARNLIVGDEVDILKEAIISHMQELGISQSEIDQYTNNIVSNGTNLEEIYTEKWVSMFGRGLQAWIDYKRTEIPTLIPNPDGLINEIPKRFTYPLIEQSTNSINKNQAIDRLEKGDVLDSSLIWTK